MNIPFGIEFSLWLFHFEFNPAKMVQAYFLGIYTAKIMLFYFFMVFAFGGFVWSTYLFFEASGSGRRRKKRQNALIWMIFFGIVLFFMGIIAILRQTELGKWFDQFLH